MAGDLTLQVLLDAAMSGYLKRIDFQPFEREPVLESKQQVNLMLALQWYYQEKMRTHISHLLQAEMASQVSMAIGNRKAYGDVAQGVNDLLTDHRNILFVGTPMKKQSKVDTSDVGELARFWESYYGMSLAEANRKGL